MFEDVYFIFGWSKNVVVGIAPNTKKAKTIDPCPPRSRKRLHKVNLWHPFLHRFSKVSKTSKSMGFIVKPLVWACAAVRCLRRCHRRWIDLNVSNVPNDSNAALLSAMPRKPASLIPAYSLDLEG